MNFNIINEEKPQEKLPVFIVHDLNSNTYHINTKILYEEYQKNPTNFNFAQIEENLLDTYKIKNLEKIIPNIKLKKHNDKTYTLELESFSPIPEGYTKTIEFDQKGNIQNLNGQKIKLTTGAETKDYEYEIFTIINKETNQEIVKNMWFIFEQKIDSAVENLKKEIENNEGKNTTHDEVFGLINSQAKVLIKEKIEEQFGPQEDNNMKQN